MWDWLLPVAMLGVWFVLMRWALPGIGVST